jgi:small subunit ribosomal protein S19e
VTTVYDVPAEPLIDRIASEMEDEDAVEPPEWAPFVRTGAHKERPPEQQDWWFTRTAAVLRKVYLEGPIGTERLSRHYGGKRRSDVSPHHSVKGSRNIIRTVLQQLEEAGYLDQSEDPAGRQVTPDGQSFLDDLAHEVQQDLTDERPELAKY